jgi:hypothetical protein
MTVCGGWSLVKHEGPVTRAITLWCRSWQCPDCAPYRIGALKRFGRDGRPTTFLTLTVNPRHGQSPEERAAELSNAWKIVVKRARRKFTKEPLEYLAIFEATKKGEPHLHILMRAPYIPQKWISQCMDELIEAPIVDIRRVGSAKNAAAYVAKYVGKGPKPFASLKRYWSSKNYQVDNKRPPKSDDPWGRGWRVWKEPLIVLRDIFTRWGGVVEWSGDHEFAFIVPDGTAPDG